MAIYNYYVGGLCYFITFISKRPGFITAYLIISYYHECVNPPVYVTGFVKIVPIGTTIEIHFMA